MIPVTSSIVFDTALQALSSYKKSVGRNHRGRFVQIFLGLKFFQNHIPSIHSGRFMSSGVIQSLLDDLYTKSSQPLHSSILMPFEGTYLARTGVTAPGHAGPQNTWRNNLHIQKGIVCYAPANILAGSAFLNQPRGQCQFLVSPPANTFSHSRCSLCADGEYRKEQHRKWLRMDPNGNGYAAIDSSDISNFIDYVAPQGKRIPALPLIVALYNDAGMGLITASRQYVAMSDFMSDFNFSYAEFAAYFDDDPANPYNQAVLAAGEGFVYQQASTAQGHIQSQPSLAQGGSTLSATAMVPTIPLPGTTIAPPLQNSGWDAQQCVADALAEAGWAVYDVSRQQMGCDLLANRRKKTVLVEVKSSVAACAPSLTAREWAQAKAHGAGYVLAVIENFDPANTNVIYWITNPAVTCKANTVSTTNYSIARSAWIGAAVSLDAI